MELVHRKMIAGFWPHSNLSLVVGGSPCGEDRPGAVVTPALSQRQRRRRIVIDEGEETRGGGEVEWIVIDEERGIASSDHQIQLCHAIYLSRYLGQLAPHSASLFLTHGWDWASQSGRPRDLETCFDLVVILCCSALWQGILGKVRTFGVWSGQQLSSWSDTWSASWACGL